MYGTTTMAASPMTYAAAPAATYAAAPAATYAAAPAAYATTAAPSYVAQPAYAAPVAYAAPAATYATQAYTAPAATTAYTAPAVSYAAPVAAPVAAPMVAEVFQQPVLAAANPIVPPAAPMAPAKLTQGIPTPEQITQQKAGYSAALDKQLKDAIETVQKETAIEKEMIKFNAEKQIALYNMQVDEKLAEAVALADEESVIRLCELNKAKVERNLQLNNQANGLIMDYQMKAVQTELAQKQYVFQTQYMQAENKLAQDYNQQVAMANTGTTYAVPAQAVR